MNYVLDEQGKPKAEPDIQTWSRWFESADRRVAIELLTKHRVSTVFLGLDQQFGDGPPLLYETMVFERGGWTDLACDRYATREDAMAGHNSMVDRVRAGEFDRGYGKFWQRLLRLFGGRVLRR